MINWEEFNNQYKYFGNEFVVMLIELYIKGDENENSPSYDERISLITNAIAQIDYPGIKFHAHRLKGSISIFYDHESQVLAGILEWMGTQHVDDGLGKEDLEKMIDFLDERGIENTDEGMTVIFEMLKIASEKLLLELKEHLKTIS
jgi:hypothetical protein